MAQAPDPLAKLGNLAYFFGGSPGVLPSFATGEDATDKRQLSAALRSLSTQILPLLQRSNAGGALSSTIIEKLEELIGDEAAADKASILQAIAVCAESAGEFATPATPSQMLSTEDSPIDPVDGDESKSNPGLVAFQVFPSELTFGSRDTDTLDIFFNAISNIEWSRSVPFFDLMIISSGKPVDDTGRPLTMSQHLFLSPNGELSESDQRLASALPPEIIGEDLGNDETAEVGTVTAAGMELFTAPQTLVNANEQYFDPPGGTEGDQTGHATLDPFRPFMTLKSFHVSIQTGYALSAFKTAKATITLHDRSRLAQIAPLVRPDLYGGTELRVEYGWSHPDAVNAPDTNPVAEFINSLRCKEKYRIINSSFAFQDDGQVDVVIDLAMKGSTELYTQVTTNGEGSSEAMDLLATMTDELVSLTKQLDGAGSIIEDVSGRTAIKAGSSSSAALRVDKDTAREIARFIQNNKRRGAKSGLNGIANKLQEIFGTKGKTGQIANITATANTALKKKENILSTRIDPFAAEFPLSAISTGTKTALSATAKGQTKRGYVSLGKLLMTYVGKPLQSSNQFDEVQFVFYCFNKLAGHVRHHNIAQFPINVSDFKNAYRAAFKPTLSTGLSSFIDFLNEKFIMNESTSKVYGLDAFYDSEGKLKTRYQKDMTTLTGPRTDALNSAYPDGHPVEFRKPQLELAFECVPVATFSTSNPELLVTNEQKTVLRIHVHDKAATAFSPQASLLAAMGQNNFGVVTANDSAGTPSSEFGNQENTAQHGELLAKVYDYFQSAKIISQYGEVTINGAPGSTRMGAITSINASTGKLKEFVRKTTPSCIIGSTGNPVLGASLSSMNDPALASIRIAAATTSGKGAVQGNAEEGFPTFIQPTQLSVEMFGMPLLAYSSNVFFDFNTNTNVDNIYVCTGVDHNFGPGEFKTSAKFTQVDAFEKFRSVNTSIERLLVRAALSLDDGEELTGEQAGSVTVNLTPSG